jgi:hypothetical protein
MNISTIDSLLNDSTWSTTDNNLIYKFSNGKDLWINGNNHLKYSLKRKNKKVQIRLDNEKEYFVEFIDDFTLYFYNEKERIVIMPESNF